MGRIFVALVLFLLLPACASWPRIYEYHDPLTPEEHLALGVSYESEGRPQPAIAEYKKVLESDAPRHRVTARVFLGNAYAELQQFETAEQYYREALSLDPGHGQALNNLASLYARQGIKLEDAESLARAALAQSDKERNVQRKAFYLETLGEILLRRERYFEALESLRQAEDFQDTSNTSWL